MLLERGGADPNMGAAEDGVTPVFAAAEQGHLEIVKVLVEARADVNLARRHWK